MISEMTIDDVGVSDAGGDEGIGSNAMMLTVKTCKHYNKRK